MLKSIYSQIWIKDLFMMFVVIMTYSGLMDRNVLPGLCWSICSAAHYHNVKVLWI